MESESIVVRGAREHNLRDITVRIPRNRLTVITGLSGSGKSSLAFDTLYAEGQRRYVESVSAYARQFLHQLQKPDVDHIEGLSPAIAIEQRTAASNPRSIVATTTEIYDYLRLLYEHLGEPHCPTCGKRVQRQTPQQIVDRLNGYPERTRLTLLAPVVSGRKGKHEDIIAAARRDGFVRLRVDGEVHELDELPTIAARKVHDIEIVVDRLIVSSEPADRLTDSVETTLKHGSGIMVVVVQQPGAEAQDVLLSERNSCDDCGVSFPELTARSFSFNSPYGACNVCDGLGTQLVLDPSLLVSDPSLSLDGGAIAAWRKGGRRLITHYKKLLRAVARHYDVDLKTPYEDLPSSFQDVLMHGSGEEDITYTSYRAGKQTRQNKPFEGVIPNLMRRYNETESEYARQQIRRVMTRRQCPSCGGARLRREALACTIAGRSIVDVTMMSVRDALAFHDALTFSEREAVIAGDIVAEIHRRLSFLENVGLDYLTLNRESGTLSGGELQRIRLATQIGSGLVGVLYVLDEPTVGLHQRDNTRLLALLKSLRDLGNTVVVVEHDEQMIRAADHVIDLGPGAGSGGGEVVHEGTVESLLADKSSLTARYMNAPLKARSSRRPRVAGRELTIVGADEHNLKCIDVTIPLGLLVCVTGVSGSGKSTLIDDILRRALAKRLYQATAVPGKHETIEGVEQLDKVVVIDQSPIGRTPRSNPATYTGALTDIRNLFAATTAAKVRGYGPGRFSFNVKGGRCETCRGDGILKLEMHFLPDVYVPCEACEGHRFNRDTLGVHYGGKSIAEVLDMTVADGLEFFAPVPKIARKLQTLNDVGLGYLSLGQPATTLSGGEAQRIKLSSELSKRGTGQTLYLLDEPTTGLHFADVERLMAVLDRLCDQGNSVLVIEHNIDVIRNADYLIDLGLEGGDAGGELVAAGTPEEVAADPKSHTGSFLRGRLS